MDSYQNTEQLYAQDQNGVYHIVFRNGAALEVEEIKEIFSKYGKVYSVKECGDKTGYRFIRYKYFDEVEKAINGMKDHPKIKLVPPRRDKENNKIRNQNNSQNEEYTHNNHNERNKYYDKKEKNGTFKNNDDVNEKINEFNNKVDNIECKIDYNNAEPRNGSNDNLLASCGNNLSNNLPLDTESQRCDQGIADATAWNTKQRKASDVYTRIVVIDAGEVIIGNIHPNYGASYILHLVESFEPIAISNIEILPKSNIRYCHVYFKTIQICKQVENSFDQMDLAGKKLIVQQPLSLIQCAKNYV